MSTLVWQFPLTFTPWYMHNIIHVTNPKNTKVKLKVNSHKNLTVMSPATGFYYYYSPHLYIWRCSMRTQVKMGRYYIPTHPWKNDGKALRAGSHGVLSPKSLEVNPCKLICWDYGNLDLPFHMRSQVLSPKYDMDACMTTFLVVSLGTCVGRWVESKTRPELSTQVMWIYFHIE